MIAVTGANGFVGAALVRRLVHLGIAVRPLARRASGAAGALQLMGDIGPETDWSSALAGVDCVVHCAARVHVMQEHATDAHAAFRSVNSHGTRRLAEQAALAGVKRLVFLSSVKVNGESTRPGSPFKETDAPAPQDAYGQSKWEAEQALWAMAKTTGLEVVVIRPPLVYGSGVRANLERLMKLVAKGLPLPLGSVDNKRSLVALDNLIDLMIRCVDHPAASGQTLMVSDDEDLSTPELVRRMAQALHRPVRLVPVPLWLLRWGGRLSGRGAEVERLVGSLQVDITHTRGTLDWRPPIGVNEGLLKMVKGHKS